jgi:hypothetical protein
MISRAFRLRVRAFTSPPIGQALAADAALEDREVGFSGVRMTGAAQNIPRLSDQRTHARQTRDQRRGSRYGRLSSERCRGERKSPARCAGFSRSHWQPGTSGPSRAIALNQGDDLFLAVASQFAGNALVGVLLGLLAADIGFVAFSDLSRSTHRGRIGGVHGLTDAVAHEPCGLVGDAQRAV